MSTALLIIATCIINYTAIAIIAGLAFFSIFKHKLQNRLSWQRICVFTAFFAVWELLWVPALMSTDITFSIGNPEIAEVLGIKDPISLTEQLIPGGFDLAVWFIQAVVADYTGRRLLLNDSMDRQKHT